jgi:hypothetical protein
MRYLKSYNEGLFNLFRRDKGKNDLYVTSANYKKKIGPSDINDNNSFYAIYFPEMKLSFIKNHIVKGKYEFKTSSKGVFGNFGGWSWDPYDFQKKEYVGSTSVWYDIGDDLFINLNNISDELGYRVNQTVHVLPTGKDSKILEIMNVAFYKTSGYSWMDECFTLLYKVEGDDSYYQVGHLDIIEISEGDKNIVDEVIEENFFELIDEGLIDFTSEEFTQKGKKSYKCLVKVTKDMTPEVLFKISECLLVASRRLNDIGIYIDIESMKHTEERSGTGTTDIVFIAIQK